MPKIAIFADEIGPALVDQLAGLRTERISAVELRSVGGKNVLDLVGPERAAIRAGFRDAGVEVFSIGSPVGKMPIEAPEAQALEQTQRAIEQAVYFGASRIRVFSFFVEQDQLDQRRTEVIDRLSAMAELALAAGVLLCHENESRIYGQAVARCSDLLAAVNSPALRAVHDTANYLVHGEEAYPAGLDAVWPWLEYVHIKDYGDGAVQPAGQGEGRMPELLAALQDRGWNGYLSLEPHLGPGPQQYRRAASALRSCLDALHWAWE